MPLIECGKGHIYNTDTHSACPYCASGEVRVTDPRKTLPADGAVSVAAAAKTMPPEGFYPPGRPAAEAGATVGVMCARLGTDPVVGWLVCVDGPDKGNDYRLLGRVNSIGRSEEMDVCVRGDDTISARCHAKLSYSEASNRFFLSPAENKNVIFHNGTELLMPAQLAPFDRIMLGRTTLLFVPLCTEQFTWGAADGACR